AVLVFLHYTLRPILAWRASPDFLIIALLLAAVRVRPGVAAIIGFIIGLASDSLALGAFGAGALAMTLIGFSWSKLKAVFFADHVIGYTVSVLAQREDTLRAVLQRLTGTINISPTQIEQAVRRFRRAPTRPAVILPDASFDVVSVLEEHRSQFPQLNIQSS